jgi:hypothetical protein
MIFNEDDGRLSSSSFAKAKPIAAALHVSRPRCRRLAETAPFGRPGDFVGSSTFD